MHYLCICCPLGKVRNGRASNNKKRKQDRQSKTGRAEGVNNVMLGTKGSLPDERGIVKGDYQVNVGELLNIL